MKPRRKYRGKEKGLRGLEEVAAAYDRLQQWCHRRDLCFRLEVAAAISRHLKVLKGKP